MTRHVPILMLFLILLAPSVSALDTAVPAVRARGGDDYSPLTAWEMGFTGRGVGVAIIDGGVDDEHPDLKGRFVAGADFTVPDTPLTPRDGSFNPDDNGGHGTHCAGCVMASGNSSGGKYRGVAPNASLIDLKVYRALEVGRLAENIVMPAPDRMMEAINWTIEHKDEYNIRVISISMAVNIPNSNGTDRLSQMVNRAVQAGIVVVVAAGNDGPNNRGFNPPASADEAIVVGAVDDKGTVSTEDDVVADFSSRGPRASDGDSDPYDEFKPDVVAPGVDITSTANSFTRKPATGYSSMSGTSFAAPIVAGVVALMLEANPSLTPRQVKEILHVTAEARGRPYDKSLPYPHNKWNPMYGYGIVNAYDAVRMALRLKGVYIPPPHLNEVSEAGEGGNFTLTWSSVPGAESYVLLESDDPTFSHYTSHYYIEGTEYQFSGVPPGTYYFRVVARGMGTYSNMSNTVTVVVSGGSGPPPPLPAPQFRGENLTVSEGNYTVSWTSVEGATGYILQEASSPDFSDGRDIYRGVEASFRVEGRVPGDYYYRVRAYGEGRASSWSDALHVRVIGGGENGSGGNETGGGGGVNETGVSRGVEGGGSGLSGWMVGALAFGLAFATTFAVVLLYMRRRK